MKQVELEHLGVKIPKKLNQELTAAVMRGDYVNKSDLTRTAIRKLLEKED